VLFRSPVSGTVTANVGTTNGLALDATLTGGSQKTKLIDTGGTNVASVSATGALKVDGSAVTQPVSGTFWQAAQPVTDNSGSLTVDAPVGTPVFVRLSDGAAALIGQKAMSASVPVVIASDQGAIPIQHVLTGATNILKTGTLTTTAVTADQVVLTYTVTSGKTLYLQYVVMYGRLTAVSATASILGAISLETPSGTKVITFDDMNPTTSELEFNPLVFNEPIPIAASTVVRIVVTPAATTSMLWRGNFGGYEK